MYGVVLIAVLIVMGGLIAYIGDKLGSKVGKRKLTIFGLRPKHTSILVTIITGIIIAASTLGVMSLVSDNVRTALFGMEALQARLSFLTQEVTAQTKELADSREALDVKTKEYAVLTTKISETAANLAKVNEELAAAVGERDLAAAALDRVQAEFAVARADLGKAQSEIQALQTTKDELNTRVASLNDERAKLQSDVDELNETTKNLWKDIQIAKQGVVVFRAGEVLSTSVIKGSRSAGGSPRTLESIISAANQDILNRLEVTDKNLQVLRIFQTDFEQASAQLAGTSEDTIVRIVALGNTVYGEPVVGRIELFPNRLVYSAGDVVFTQKVDAGTSGKEAEETVLAFLQKVNNQAINSGILPDPLQGTVGVMGGAQLFETVNRVSHAGGRVELTAVAKNDTYTVGPLQIEIRVRSLP